ncbi:MAG: ABC transporter ATP-binding protein [Candidatus Zixiibacteriota bacterium]|nr:MAG: ABC transporter ATP-binding protein [candidate division Zixibacteria bacterium]
MMKVLQIENARKRYKKTVALDGVSVSLGEGYVMGIVGPNGAGKTTLMKAILNLIRLDDGSIEAFGLDHLSDERAVRARIGFVHEASYLFDQLNAAQLERITRAAYPRWDSDLYHQYLDRFELSAKPKVKTYSKGMKMRLSVAVALSHEAELIIMDEPSSGLDPLVRRDLISVIGEELAKDHRSFLISTHITSDLDRIADYVVLLDHARVRLAVTKEELSDEYALCRGGRDLLKVDTNGYFTGIQLNDYGFVALTTERANVKRKFGDKVVMERPTIEDLMVHTLAEKK